MEKKAKFTASIAENAYNNKSKICKNPFVGKKSCEVGLKK